MLGCDCVDGVDDVDVIDVVDGVDVMVMVMHCCVDVLIT